MFNLKVWVLFLAFQGYPGTTETAYQTEAECMYMLGYHRGMSMGKHKKSTCTERELPWSEVLYTVKKQVWEGFKS